MRRNLKKISAILPKNLLEEAIKLSELNQTETLIAGLKELIARQRRIKALRHLGKIHIDLDIEKVRQRQVF